jgi:hypothetical protein
MVGRSLVTFQSVRLLTETDGPFVLEQGQPATPLDIDTVVTALAKVRGHPTVMLTRENMKFEGGDQEGRIGSKLGPAAARATVQTG